MTITFLFFRIMKSLKMFSNSTSLYFSIVFSKKCLKLVNISFWEGQSGPKWPFCIKNIVLRNANFWDLFWNKRILCFVSYDPAWSSDDRKIINKVLGYIFCKHILWISGSGFWNPIFDMIWHCVLAVSQKLL